ncbi:MAG: Crp/Fnr family transcriptional regulator [Bacteroidales bacterium]|nr:Crp/Fnr family transcriptional regulator [Bacteroidales bacterium]
MLKTFDELNKSSCCDCIDMSCAVSLLNKAQFELLSNHSIESEIKKGEIIIRSDVLISNIIYLKTGYVKEFVVSSSKKSRIIQILKPHTYLGIHSLFGDKINHYSYAALEDLKICYIDINTFKQLVKENGNFAFQILSEVGKENLYNYYRFISNSHKKTDGRFADILLYLAEKIYENNHFPLQLTRQEMGDLVGVSRENLTRVMTKFKQEGIIEVTRDHVQIVKDDILRTISKNG